MGLDCHILATFPWNILRTQTTHVTVINYYSLNWTS